jgi:hypothetical protein
VKRSRFPPEIKPPTPFPIKHHYEKRNPEFHPNKACPPARIHRSPVLHLFVLWAALSLPLCAQTERGQITGIVWDPSGAVIPGAQATLVNLGTGVRSETVTNRAGLYAFPTIPAGKNKAVYSKSGFKTSEQTGVTLSVAQQSADVAEPFRPNSGYRPCILRKRPRSNSYRDASENFDFFPRPTIESF